MPIVPRRGINSRYQYHKVRGEGTEENPYEDVTVNEDGRTDPVSVFLSNTLATDLTLSGDPVYNVTTLQVDSPTVAPVVGQFLSFSCDRRQTQVEILSVTPVGGTVYTVGIGVPLDCEYAVAGLVLHLEDCDMAVDGSITPVVFDAGPCQPQLDWDLTRMMIAMYHTAAADDSTFGGIPKLTNGVFFRIENGQSVNLYNARENADFRAEGYDVDYPDRSLPPAGQYGTNARISFSGPEKRGVVIRLFGEGCDKFQAQIRDDLTGLSYFRVKIQGHVVDL